MAVNDEISRRAMSGLVRVPSAARTPAREQALFRSGEVLADLALRVFGSGFERVRVATSWVDADYIASGFVRGLDAAGIDSTLALYDMDYSSGDDIGEGRDLAFVTHKFHEDRDAAGLTVIVLSSLGEPDTVATIMARLREIDAASRVVVAAPGATFEQLAGIRPYLERRRLENPALLLGISPNDPLAPAASAFGWSPSAGDDGRPDTVPEILKDRMAAKSAAKAATHPASPAP